MANTFNPFGFDQYQGTGSAPTYEITRMVIKNGNTTAAFFGDPMSFAYSASTGLGNGYISQMAPPIALTITGFALSNGLVTATYSAPSSAVPVGSVLVLNGMTTATTLNGSWQIVSSTSTTAVFPYSGGALSTQSTTGYVFQPIQGIFVGCEYLSTVMKRPIWSNYYPGTTDPTGDIAAYVVTDPNAQFLVQTANSNTTATAVGLANVNQAIGFNYINNGGSQSNGNTANGLSTQFADQYTLAANFPTGQYAPMFMPFRIITPQNYVAQGSSPWSSINGSDVTTAYNNVIVGFNNNVLKDITAYG